MLQSTYAKHNVSIVTGAGSNRDLLEFEEAYQGWQGVPNISERDVARAIAVAGGQGHGLIKCNCQGP